jgi:hypothetical protein
MTQATSRPMRVSCSVYPLTLKMEVVCSSKMSFDFHYTTLLYCGRKNSLQPLVWDPHIQHTVYNLTIRMRCKYIQYIVNKCCVRHWSQLILCSIHHLQLWIYLYTSIMCHVVINSSISCISILGGLQWKKVWKRICQGPAEILCHGHDIWKRNWWCWLL